MKEKSAILKTLEVAKILKANGVNLKALQLSNVKEGKCVYKNLAQMEQEGIDFTKIIEENGLDKNFPYGRRMQYIRQVYKGKWEGAITEDDRKEIEELGLLEKEKTKPSVITKTLRVAKILQDNGVNVKTLQITHMKNGKYYYNTLEQMEQKGVDFAKIIEENGLDGNFKYGRRINYIRQVYKGNLTNPITMEERKQVEELGIVKNRLSKKEAQKQKAIQKNEQVKKLYEKYKRLYKKYEKLYKKGEKNGEKDI